jgi:hypothetical protein
MRRAIHPTLISGAAMAIAVAALVMFDERVRRSFGDLVSGSPPAEFAQAGSQAYRLGSTMMDAVVELSVANAPLLVFVVIATTLMLFMVRT